ncbi:MAG: hypothetical protein A2X61_08430 [Ignavibacteria bacterium GWB2_35_12]|nr:MAG: hypothetical protein A2X63_02320 [Ignavibacteria bacterium GWA2_35_8]OGU40182.1 MAG: hypothetical protein A2X61_08430 [Ignavibacteria bacterium GWB2_35_12]OGU92376.1 MAG: hypothetical protein A2220_16875 [Ignavibacteria bacterium RIFOXYA2_FULL_35_10]OGV22337.1 MAG: hypothetical protein A2475_15715 [Ignavibacteria bacterium RIFOXYC2_FULL_35_21]
MIEKELQNYLFDNYPKENESCEWKGFQSLIHSVSGSTGDDIISYISAISNMEGGSLLIGVKDDTIEIIGIKEFHNYTTDNIKLKILEQCPNLTSEGFDVEELIAEETGKIVWIFHIPKHKPRQPVLAHNRIWQRVNDSLVEIRPERKEAILSEPAYSEDWSAGIVPDATIDDLDYEAIKLARKNYKEKSPGLALEVDSWNDITFLNKAKIIIRGKITRTAIILLGKQESEHYISPAEAKIRWILKDSKGVEKDYQIEGCPLLLSLNKIYIKIRNLKYSYLKDGTLYPEEMLTYEPFTIREAINNCIAHQDYTKSGRINVIEFDDQLVFSNLGSFIPGSVEKVIIEDAPEEHYRNKFLTTAMLNLKMVDSIGSGIRKMFNFQRARFFPMPDYDLSGGKVKVTIIGKVLDMNYASLLARNIDLSLDDIILLDKVQKKQTLTLEAEKYLRKNGLIEGRKPNYFISLKISKKTGLKAVYTKNKALDKKYYLDLIIRAIIQHDVLTRSDVDELLWKKLPEWMNENQKKAKINHLLTELRIKGDIKNVGSDRSPKWILLKN